MAFHAKVQYTRLVLGEQGSVLEIRMAMNRINLLVLFAAGIFASCGSDTNSNAATTVTSNAKTDPALLGDGKAIYAAKCASCHGADGTEGLMGAKNLQTSTLDHASVVAIISNGKGAMKAYSGELNAEQIEAVAKYAESLRK
jgi:mono/diheme cytochrome c family protein